MATDARAHDADYAFSVVEISSVENATASYVAMRDAYAAYEAARAEAIARWLVYERARDAARAVGASSARGFPDRPWEVPSAN